MTHGHSEIDVHHCDIARFYPHQRTASTPGRARPRRSSRPTASCTRPSSTSPTAAAAVADERVADRSSVRSSSRPPAGNGRMWYESNAAAARRVRRRGDAARARVGLALVDARSSTPSTCGCARPAGVDRPDGVRDLRHRSVRARSRPCSGSCVAQCDVAVGKVDLHPGARRRRRLPLRPHRDAPGRRPLPRRHRRRPRHGRPEVVRRPPARTTAPPTLDRPHRRRLHDRAVGPAGPRHPRVAHLRRRLRRGLRVPAPAARSRSAALPVLASRISYVGELGWELYVPMDAARAELWETAARGGRAARRGPGRHRRLRHHRPAREGLPRVRLRARRRAHASSRPACSGPRSRPPTSSAARPTSRSARRRRQTVLCTLTVDDHTSRQRHEALHARRRADPDPRRRDRSPTATATTPTSPRRARRRRWASTCCWPTCPPDQATIGNELAVSYMEELYPVTVGSVDATAAARPRATSGSGLTDDRTSWSASSGCRTPPARCC